MTLHYASTDPLAASKYVISKDPIERMLKGVIKADSLNLMMILLIA